MPELLYNVTFLQTALLFAISFFMGLFWYYVKQKVLLISAVEHDEYLNKENHILSKAILHWKEEVRILKGLNDHQFDVLSKNATTIESLESEVRFLRDQQNSKPVSASVVDHMPKTSSTQPAKRRNRTRGNHPGVGKSIP